MPRPSVFSRLNGLRLENTLRATAMPQACTKMTPWCPLFWNTEAGPTIQYEEDAGGAPQNRFLRGEEHDGAQDEKTQCDPDHSA